MPSLHPVHRMATGLAVFLCAAGLYGAGTGRNSPRVSLSTAAPGFTAMWIGNRPVTAAELQLALQTLPPPQRAGFTLHPELAVQWYGRLVALSQEARREHLDRGLDLRHGSIVDHRNALVAALVQKIAHEVEPTPAQIDAYYRQHAETFMQTRARVLRVSDRTSLASHTSRTPQQAWERIQTLAQQLHHGADFAALARENSDDSATRAQGGELNYVSRHTRIPEIDRLLWTLPPGQISAPVPTRFGYELVQVEDRRPMPLAQAQPLILGQLRMQAITAQTQAIVAAARIRMNPQLATHGSLEAPRAERAPDAGNRSRDRSDQRTGVPTNFVRGAGER